ncbi:unnamed protein product [Brassicogethes aeneus]|uniref:Uncharacterized protein n=1 Tax=Brassicogethes aeneus TaxID=1431903 RepID=A0A9P0ATK4_BRAAE|nr:unnamed protein product [Brassicogethes aeneus]
MSGRTLLSRPRTRVYDANYNIGESYYKSAIDRLDRKYSGRPLSPAKESPMAADIAERHAAAFADEDLSTSRRRAGKLINEDHVFDSRGGRIGRRTYDDDVDNETSAALRRIRANKKVSIIDDVDLESTSNNIKTFRMLDRSEKMLNSVGINENSRRTLDEDIIIKRRAAANSAASEEAGSLEKWTSMAPVAEEVHSAAALRVKASRERLSGLEDEMAAMAEKQAARERRVARLKALVAENESEDSSDVVESSVSVSARKERKSVRF